MKGWLLFLILIVCAKLDFAQTFNKTSTFNLSTFYFRSLLVKDSSIYAAGFGADTNEPSKPKMYIANFNSNGTLLKFVNPLDTLSDSFYSAENSILDFDSTLIFLTKYSNSSVFNNPFLFATNKQLKIKSLKKLEFPNYSSVNSFGLIKVSKTKFLLFTSVQYKSGDNIDVFLHLINRDFSIVWSKIYGVQNKYDVPYSAVNLNSGNLLIGAHRTDAGMTVAGQRFKEQTWIFEIDTAGNMVREFLDTNTRTGPAKGLTPTQDGGFVYGSTYQYLWDGVFDYTYRAYLSKINHDLNKKDWEFVFENELKGNERINQIVAQNNEEFIGVGRKYADINSKKAGNEIPGFLSKFNSNGKILWNKYYAGLDSSDEVYFNELIHVTSDNGNNIIACGEAYRFNSPKQGWLLKLDEDGCLKEDACGEALSIDQKDSKAVGLQIYPNPVKETLFINTQESIEYLKIYNTLGQLVVEQNSPPNQVNISSLRSGLYFMNVKTAKVVFTKKFVKE